MCLRSKYDRSDIQVCTGVRRSCRGHNLRLFGRVTFVAGARGIPQTPRRQLLSAHDLSLLCGVQTTSYHALSAIHRLPGVTKLTRCRPNGT